MTKPIAANQTIGEVIKAYPNTAHIMQEYGLHCVSCAINPYETIEQGALGHGMDTRIIERMVEDMNLAVTKKPDYDLNPDGITVSPRAVMALKEIAKDQGKKDWGLRVKAEVVTEGLDYYLDIEDAVKDGDMVLSWQGVKMFVDKGTVDLINPSVIDFLQTNAQEGFKVISLKEVLQEESSCCGGGCACGTKAHEKEDCCGEPGGSDDCKCA